jgi:GABA(A) receptor-associated protein
MFESFKQHSLFLRKEQATRLLIKYPNRIPVILERYQNSTSAPLIDKNKFLVPRDATVGTFVFIVRKRLQMNEKQALFLFCSSSIPPVYETIAQVYERNKDEDGFLYMCYTTENTFGCENCN